MPPKRAPPTYKIMRFAPLKARLPSAKVRFQALIPATFAKQQSLFLGGIHVPQRVQSDGTLQKSASCKLFALCSHKLHVHIILFKGIGHKARTVSAENDGRSRRRPTQESYNTSRIRKAMQNTDNKRFVAIGLMLFAILFGAGNLIFPASMGQASGDHFVWAFIGFCITGVGLPLLAIMAMAYAGCNDLQEAAGRAHPLYGLFYTVVVYMSIGPCFAIPRTGTVAFEIGLRPFLTEGQVEMGLWIFLVLFFVVSYWLAATPQKLVDRVGKILTPALVLTLGALIVKSVVDPLGVPQAAQPNYGASSPPRLRASLAATTRSTPSPRSCFATLVTNFVREGGAKTAKEVTSQVYKSGILAVSLLAVIYFFIAKIGAESVTAIGMQDTGAPVLAETAKILFGNFGAILLSVIVLLACLTTSIGLITCCAAYFMRIVGRLTYKQYCLLFTIVSFLIGMFGLKTIIVSTIPVLMFVYPLCVILIVLLFTDKLFDGRQCVYAFTTAFTFVMAAVSGLETAGVNLGAISKPSRPTSRSPSTASPGSRSPSPVTSSASPTRPPSPARPAASRPDNLTLK